MEAVYFISYIPLALDVREKWSFIEKKENETLQTFQISDHLVLVYNTKIKKKSFPTFRFGRFMFILFRLLLLCLNLCTYNVLKN